MSKQNRTKSFTAETLYFEMPGSKNTAATISAAKKRALELGIKHVVVASTSGSTALQAAKAFEGTGIALVCVGEHYGFWGEDSQKFDPEIRTKLERSGAKILICSHALSGVERSLTKDLGGTSRVEVIANTLRRFGSDGLKVAVEIAIMAADAGLIRTDEEVIAIGGTHRGCDTAIVLRPAHMNNFFDLEIREIVAIPRQRSSKK